MNKLYKNKLSKKNIKDILEGVENPPFDWSIYYIYIFKYENKVDYFIQYNGQGTMSIIYNNECQECHSLSEYDLFLDYTTKKDKIQCAYEVIIDLFQ